MTRPLSQLSRRDFISASAAAAATAVVAPATVARAAEFVTIGSGHSGGSFYPVGVAVANAVGAGLRDVRVQVQQTGGSHENIQLVTRGRAELGLALADTLSMAHRGSEPKRYPKPLPDLRGIAAIFPSYVHLLVRADSGIKRIEDLRGRNITVGAPGGGSETNARAILAAAGMSFADLGRVEFLSGDDTGDAIRNRRIDGFFLSTGLGASAVRELETSVELAAVPILASVVAAIGDGAYISSEMQAGAYRVQGLPAPSVVIWTHLFCDEKQPSEKIQSYLAAVFDKLDAFRSTHASLREFSIERAVMGMPIPFHEGAKAFFASRGVKIG
ncbi:TAXI family TRAP transporter solute-binding subunit [Bradyrhizobium sp. LHD-71]|uniref:TAXI family TRAP transporter solute-binding subunit n=1 Tax=Bradyrhizobium sp. LHD-71 TaxID=3072141 RepID=UPI00280FB19D|nr:TAXI family TRAP transporter solute-binding subunit [Bradyrhizobium sp. LHD-71]MDQ8730229.1 TAXI family TRAP transporter solute-binding subunit [Bradyrhizobium sp. LHD-71]